MVWLTSAEKFFNRNLLNSEFQSIEGSETLCTVHSAIQNILYNTQINARALIGQLAVGYCAGKPTEKLRVFWIII